MTTIDYHAVDCSFDREFVPILTNRNDDNKEHILRLYNEITVDLPEQLNNLSLDDAPLEICYLGEDFLNDIIQYADADIGLYYESNYNARNFRNRLVLTIRELFLSRIIKYDLSYKLSDSYQFLDRLVCPDRQNKYRKKIEIKLSTLMDHRFDQNDYSFSEQNISFLSMKHSNLRFFDRVVRMMKYLKRKEVLYINYPQYFTYVDKEPLVVPYSLDKLHRSHIKNCCYYNNLWDGNKLYKSSHSNSIMGILSYIKYRLTENES